MSESINKIPANMLAQILGTEDVSSSNITNPSGGDIGVADSKSPFDTLLNKAVDALEGVSNMESSTNALINSYIQGNAELSDVMIATAKLNLMVQLATTTVTSAVNTFKEITQMQV